MVKKLDFVIIGVLMALSFLPEIIYGKTVGRGYSSTYAQVTVNGEIYKTIPLSEHVGEDVFEIKTEKGINVVEVKDNKIGIIEADCLDKVCMNPAYIQKAGESLVCLPHKVMIEIRGIDDDDIILSY